MEKITAILAIIFIGSLLTGTKLHEEHRDSQAFSFCAFVSMISGVLLIASSISVLLP